MKEIIPILNSNKIIALRCGQLVGILSPLNGPTLKLLATSIDNINLHHACILITSIEQLYDYTRQIPEIAWDIVEFEENALIVQYPSFNEPIRSILPPETKPRILLLKNHPLQNPLHIYRKGLFFLYNQNMEILKQNLAQFEYVLNLNPDKFELFNPKVIQLEMNGEIKFL